jgi:hypothetical protein
MALPPGTPHMAAMDMESTIALLAAGLVLLAAAIAGAAARRRAPLAWHAHLPWNGLALLGMLAALLAGVHLISLTGH